MDKDKQTQGKVQGFAAYSAYLGDRVYNFLRSLLVELDFHLDWRLVETFLALVMVLITHRHRNHGLLLSELGGYLLPPEHAPAGTKRLSNLLRSTKWQVELIIQFFWQQADRRVAELRQAGETVLAIWDVSVNEAACLRLVSAILVDIDDAWQTGRMNLTFESDEPSSEP